MATKKEMENSALPFIINDSVIYDYFLFKEGDMRWNEWWREDMEEVEISSESGGGR